MLLIRFSIFNNLDEFDCTYVLMPPKKLEIFLNLHDSDDISKLRIEERHESALRAFESFIKALQSSFKYSEAVF